MNLETKNKENNSNILICDNYSEKSNEIEAKIKENANLITKTENKKTNSEIEKSPKIDGDKINERLDHRMVISNILLSTNQFKSYKSSNNSSKIDLKQTKDSDSSTLNSVNNNLKITAPTNNSLSETIIKNKTDKDYYNADSEHQLSNTKYEKLSETKSKHVNNSHTRYDRVELSPNKIIYKKDIEERAKCPNYSYFSETANREMSYSRNSDIYNYTKYLLHNHGDDEYLRQREKFFEERRRWENYYPRAVLPDYRNKLSSRDNSPKSYRDSGFDINSPKYDSRSDHSNCSGTFNKYKRHNCEKKIQHTPHCPYYKNKDSLSNQHSSRCKLNNSKTHVCKHHNNRQSENEIKISRISNLDNNESQSFYSHVK
jgi:hypothetical protein